MVAVAWWLGKGGAGRGKKKEERKEKKEKRVSRVGRRQNFFFRIPGNGWFEKEKEKIFEKTNADWLGILECLDHSFFAREKRN